MMCRHLCSQARRHADRQIPMSMFADSGYSIEVHGPNGFYRSFTGRSARVPLAVRTSYERRGTELTGNVQVQLA